MSRGKPTALAGGEGGYSESWQALAIRYFEQYCVGHFSLLFGGSEAVMEVVDQDRLDG